MSGILKPASVNKIMKLDDVEAFNKRIREAKYPELEKMLFIWQTMTKISDMILIEKAKEFGDILGLTEGCSFDYSSGWLEKYKKRYKIKKYEIVGESGSVTKEMFDNGRKKANDKLIEWVKKVEK